MNARTRREWSGDYAHSQHALNSAIKWLVVTNTGNACHEKELFPSFTAHQPQIAPYCASRLIQAFIWIKLSRFFFSTSHMQLIFLSFSLVCCCCDENCRLSNVARWHF